MAYGDLPLDAPCKPNKGHEGAAIECNAIAQAIRALPITKAEERDNG